MGRRRNKNKNKNRNKWNQQNQQNRQNSGSNSNHRNTPRLSGKQNTKKKKKFYSCHIQKEDIEKFEEIIGSTFETRSWTTKDNT